MGQRPGRRTRGTLVAAAIVALLAGLACERKTPPGPAPGPAAREDEAAAPKKQPTVASLSPAATDLLLGMGAADHLVAVSNYDTDRQGVAGLPRVGDYRTQDWEKLAVVRPARMIIQLHPDRTPAGLRDRAKGLGIELVNVQIDDLNDVFGAIPQVAAAAGEEQKGAEAIRRLRGQLDTVRRRVAAAPKVRALVVVDVGGRSVAGAGTFLHDILIAAGGDNVAARMGNAWPTVDREKIEQLKPEVVIHLLPQASPQMLRQAEQFWAALPDLPAVKNKRVHYLTDWYVLLPGYHLGKLAEQLALVLHPFANVGPMNEMRTAPDPPARALPRVEPTGDPDVSR
jgi:iron complex transport system substrate-binding protein